MHNKGLRDTVARESAEWAKWPSNARAPAAVEPDIRDSLDPDVWSAPPVRGQGRAANRGGGGSGCGGGGGAGGDDLPAWAHRGAAARPVARASARPLQPSAPSNGGAGAGGGQRRRPARGADAADADKPWRRGMKRDNAADEVS